MNRGMKGVFKGQEWGARSPDYGSRKGGKQMNKNPLFQGNPELAEALEPFLEAVNSELNRLKRVIYDLHTRDRYSEARKETMSDEEIERRKKLIAKLLHLDIEDEEE